MTSLEYIELKQKEAHAYSRIAKLSKEKGEKHDKHFDDAIEKWYGLLILIEDAFTRGKRSSQTPAKW